MRIRFIRDYRGIFTGEQFYAAGEEADIARSEEIVAEGAAVAVVEPAPELPPVEPAPDAVTTAPTKRGR